MLNPACSHISSIKGAIGYICCLFYNGIASGPFGFELMLSKSEVHATSEKADIAATAKKYFIFNSFIFSEVKIQL
jgi:hypothetical protein